MTGEITLRGRVLPIGGLREKTMAAYRAGIKTIIIPKDNKADLAEVDKVVLDHITFVPADNMDMIFKTAIIFPASVDGVESHDTVQSLPAGLTAVAADSGHRPVIQQ